jgi:hypothetical protein
MLRSLGLFLLLATAPSLAKHDHDDLNYRVLMTRYNYTEDHCQYSNVVITAAMQSAVSSSTKGLFNRVVRRQIQIEDDPNDRRQLSLRTGAWAASRELVYCDTHCRCQTILACRVLNFCAESCISCGCDRRMEEELEFLWPQQDVESSLSKGVGDEVKAGEEGGIRQLKDVDEKEDCPAWNWNKDKNLSYYAINEIMTCSASRALKGLAQELIGEENWCLGDPDLLEVYVETYMEGA